VATLDRGARRAPRAHREEGAFGLPPPRALPPDIHAYSFDRAVICDRAETVDLLVANNFHFENNCAVLSIDGYPPQAFDTVRAMLRNNPRLVVYALHDATLDGCLLARRLAADPSWFQGRAQVVDVGLRPHHAAAFKGFWRKTSGHAGGSAGLSSDEAQWLARYSLELAVIRPEQVIKRLFRAMSAAGPAAVAADDGVYWVDGSFSVEASASDGGGDSFG
jgi:hypothetical protein